MNRLVLLLAFTPLLSAINTGDGFAQLPNQNMYLVENLNTRPQGGSYSAIWGYLAPDGREYAILGCYGGTQFVDITDSANITEVGWLPSMGSTWREMKVYSNYAYIVSEASNSGIQIVDLQYLPDSIRYVGRYLMPGHSTTHSISQEGHYLYLNGANSSFGNGTVIVDISNPEVPVKRGGWNGLYVHDSRILNDTIWAANIFDGKLTVINAVNKDAPEFVTSWINLPNSGPHNCAITNDRSHILVTDEIGASPQLMKIWNIDDLSNITYVTNWQPTGITTSVVHNVEIYGNYALAAHYTAGVRLVDISNPSQPTEVAWYDTYPANNGSSYSGCWGVYMFPSGKMIASDRQTGLYVLKTTVNIFAPLNSFNLSSPVAGSNITTYPNSNIVYTFTWDTSSSTATYKWIFGYPPPNPPRHMTLLSNSNILSITSGQLDQLLQGLGISQGQTIGGQWDVWAFRNNFPENDSLKSANGPRIIYFTRGVPSLTAFNLAAPPNNITVQTTPADFSNQNFNWTKSGQGVKYKWMFATPDFSSPGNIKRIYESANSGYDSVIAIRKSVLDSLAASLGASPTDSISGQWRIYGYSASDSLSSAQTYNITLRRLPISTVTIGTGTEMEAYPLDRYYNYMRWQGLWLNSELNFTGNILKIRFYQNNSVSDGMQNVKIFMKETSETTLPTGSWDTTGTTMVYSGTITSLSSPGWLEINLTTPFFHSSGNNLMIGTGRDFQQYITTYPEFAYTSTSPNYRSRRNRNDTQYPTSLTQSYNRANIQVEYTTIVGIEGNTITSIPNVYSLSQNFPNPFNPSTKINYGIPKDGLVNIKIYDLLGKEIATLVNEVKQAGYYDLDFNASHLASGVYFYRIKVNDFVATRRMMLIK